MSISISDSMLNHYKNRIYQFVFKAKDLKEGKVAWKAVNAMLSTMNTSILKKGKRRTLSVSWLIVDKFLSGLVEFGEAKKPHYHAIVWLGKSVSTNTIHKLLKDITALKVQVSPVKTTRNDIEAVEKYVCKGHFSTYVGYTHERVLEILELWKSPLDYKKKAKESFGLMLRREFMETKLEFTSENVVNFTINYYYVKGGTYNPYRYKDTLTTLMMNNPDFRTAQKVMGIDYIDSLMN